MKLLANFWRMLCGGSSGKKELGIFVLLILLCVVTGSINPLFVSARNIGNQTQQIGMYAIYAIGAAVVIITGGIDLSVGSMFALQAVLLSIMLVDKQIYWPIATLLAILFTCILGVIHGLLIARLKLQPFIVTLCGFLIYRGLARVVSPNDSTRGFILPHATSDSFPILHSMEKANFAGLPIKMPFVIMLVIAFIMWVVLHKSVYGRYLYAVGRNEEAARYSGIKTKWVIGGAYAIGGLLAGIAGILFAFYTDSISPQTHGSVYELYGIAAAVLGGCSLRGGEGSIFGVILGTTLLLLLRNMVNLLNIQSSWDFVVTGGVILAAVVIDQILTDFVKSRATQKSAAPGGFPVAATQPVESKVA
jgi:ribose transport system permease protein